MFRKKSGISPTALLIGSSILIAALSPEIRRKISGMVSGRMQHKDGTHSMQPADLIQQAFSGESGGQQHADKARHSQTGSLQPAELIKQAFGGESGGQQLSRLPAITPAHPIRTDRQTAAAVKKLRRSLTIPSRFTSKKAR
ncbi:hypothetical protein BACIT_0810 [Bacillus amyloliquefaciens]|nr:hypothetical protein BACIT_0810 [Bacillus amyloliquefaciens]